jgi:hypothetical protein
MTVGNLSKTPTSPREKSLSINLLTPHTEYAQTPTLSFHSLTPGACMLLHHNVQFQFSEPSTCAGSFVALGPCYAEAEAHDLVLTLRHALESRFRAAIVHPAEACVKTMDK